MKPAPLFVTIGVRHADHQVLMIAADPLEIEARAKGAERRQLAELAETDKMEVFNLMLPAKELRATIIPWLTDCGLPEGAAAKILLDICESMLEVGRP